MTTQREKDMQASPWCRHTGEADIFADGAAHGRKDGRKYAAQRLIEIGDEMEEGGHDCDPGWLAEKIMGLIAELESE